MNRSLKQIASVLLLAVLFFLLLIAVTRGQVREADIIATGGTFTLEKAVIAGGGREKAAAPTGENGTAGQVVAGHKSMGGQFMLRSGFWTPDSELGPTASPSTVSGRVITADGRGIANARVLLTSSTGEIRTAITASFGYFKFTEVPVGENYVVSVAAKRFTFAEPAYVLQVTDNVSGIEFVANPL